MKLTNSILFLFSLFITSESAYAVGGWSQQILVHNKTETTLFLSCQGGDQVIRKKTVTLAPSKTGYFLGDIIVDFSDLLGGEYKCQIALGASPARSFSLRLEDAQAISVWTVRKDFFDTGVFQCETEYFGSFDRPKEILEHLNQGGSYQKTSCGPIDTSIKN